MANAYVTVEELAETLVVSNEPHIENDFRRAIEAASRHIDRYCGRRFWRDAEADVARVYSTGHSDVLFIHDLAELATLKTDASNDGVFEDVWTATDYLLEPLNAVLDDRPFTQISKRGGGTFLFPTSYPATIEVVGAWGWPAVPPQVIEGTIILSSRLVKRAREAPFGLATAGFEGGSTRLAKTDPDVAALLGPFKRGSIVV
jgi:hypothetical protein